LGTILDCLFFANFKLKVIEKNELHILHISSAKSWRGGERQISFLATELKKIKVRQTIFCANKSEIAKWCSANKIDFITYDKIFSLNPLVAFEIKKICKKFAVTHIHTHDSHAHTFAVLAISLFKINIPLIVHRRVDFPIKNNFLSIWKYNHPAVKSIICVSDFIKKLIEPAIKNKQLIKTIYSGIDLSVKPIGATDLRKEFNVPDDNLIIVNLSAIAPHKDYFTFVNTAEILLKKGLKATFLLIGGDGGEATDIAEFIEKKKIKDNLIMTGHRTDVQDILAQADLMLFTSKTEGLGGATLDALLAGVPVVSTKVGGVQEIIEHGKTGLLAPIGNAKMLAEQVERMLNDIHLRQACIEKGKMKTRLFSKEKNAEKILNIYCSIY
jgi:glycosyltransferase involved in cell wall biosynthesis